MFKKVTEVKIGDFTIPDGSKYKYKITKIEKFKSPYENRELFDITMYLVKDSSIKLYGLYRPNEFINVCN